MLDAIETQQVRTLIEDFNKLDESLQNKLLNAAKCLALLYDLADTNGNDDDEQAHRLAPTA